MDGLRAEAREAVERDTEATCAVATALCEDNPTLSGNDWEFIIDVIDEGGEWRTELADLRRRRPA